MNVSDSDKNFKNILTERLAVKGTNSVK